DVIVPGRDVGGERTQRVEWRLIAPLELLVHVVANQMHRHVARSFVHHLYLVLPGDAGELSLGAKLGKLGFVVRVRDAAGPKSVAEREGDVVLREDLTDLPEAGVEEVLPVMRETPLCQNRSAPGNDTRHTVGGERHILEQHARMDREVVDTLLALLDQRV